MATLTPSVTGSLRTLRRPGRGVGVAAVLVAWVLAWAMFRGRGTLTLDTSDVTGLHTRLNDVRSSIDAGRP